MATRKTKAELELALQKLTEENMSLLKKVEKSSTGSEVPALKAKVEKLASIIEARKKSYNQMKQEVLETRADLEAAKARLTDANTANKMLLAQIDRSKRSIWPKFFRREV